MLARLLRALLADPTGRAASLDAPETTRQRRAVVRKKGFLRRIYAEWYEAVAAELPDATGAVLEIGSGAGFMRKHIPTLTTSEVFPVDGIDLVADARRLPFAGATLRAIVMTDVFHHISDASAFLDEAARCLIGGGRIVMVEPWLTGWSRFVYTRLHHELFDPNAAWSFPSSGPLSSANGALPWIVFERDRDRLERAYPLRVLRIVPLMPAAYLLSGGVSLRALAPGSLYGPWRWLEGAIPLLERHLAMFALIVVTRLPRAS